MQILKFGGASIKNSTNIKKGADILKNIDCNNTIVIVSAIGKTTNAFENIVKLIFFIRYDIYKSIVRISFYIKFKLYQTILTPLFRDGLIFVEHPVLIT